MKQLTLRSHKQSPLTSTEVDDNFLVLMQEIQSLKKGGQEVSSKEHAEDSSETIPKKNIDALLLQLTQEMETYKTLYHTLKKQMESYADALKTTHSTTIATPIVLQPKDELNENNASIAPYTLSYHTTEDGVELCLYINEHWTNL